MGMKANGYCHFIGSLAGMRNASGCGWMEVKPCANLFIVNSCVECHILSWSLCGSSHQKFVTARWCYVVLKMLCSSGVLMNKNHWQSQL